VIEVTGDGKTAKGVWIGIRFVARTDAQTGEAQCFWEWDTYGVDFIKKDGVWKFWHFHIYRIFRCAQRMKKSITSIPTRTMDAPMKWEWPGNVRELENFIERSVILTQGSVLVSPLGEMESTAKNEQGADETFGSDGARAYSSRFAREPRADWRAARGSHAAGIEADNAAIEAEVFGD
jgi:hypothetical protein